MINNSLNKVYANLIQADTVLVIFYFRDYRIITLEYQESLNNIFLNYYI